MSLRIAARRAWAALVIVLAVLPLAARAEESQAARVLYGFLTAEQAGAMHVLGNWLATYNLTEPQVDQLIAAAGATTSEERRKELWHALRCTRGRAARELLQRNLVEDCDDATKIRYLKSLTNLAPFDVPLLIGLYQLGSKAPAECPWTDKSAPVPLAGKQVRRSGVPPLLLKCRETPHLPSLSEPESDVRDAIVELATRDDKSLVEELSGRPEFISEQSVATYAITQQRARQARQAKAELPVWIAKHAAIERHRLAVILPAYDILDSDHQKQLALDILAIVKKPDERARVMPLIIRRYGIDLVPYLVRDDEDETSKLGILHALHDLGSSYGYSMGAISHGQSTFQYVSKNDPSPKVREAAQRLLHRLSGGSSEYPRPEPVK